MTHEVTIFIGPFGLAVRGLSEHFWRQIGEPYQAFKDGCFCRSRYVLDVTIQDGRQWPGEISVLRNDAGWQISGEGFSAKVDQNQKAIVLALLPEKTIFNTFLRVLISLLAPGHDGCLVHAAGLSRQGQGYLFVGPSESGKTTTARQAAGFGVLNDELVLVTQGDQALTLFATPFCGEYDGLLSVSKVPLKKILFLNKKLNMSYKIINKSQIMTQTMANIFCFDDSFETGRALLALARKVAEHAPGFQVDILAAGGPGKLINDLT